MVINNHFYLIFQVEQIICWNWSKVETITSWNNSHVGISGVVISVMDTWTQKTISFVSTTSSLVWVGLCPGFSISLCSTPILQPVLLQLRLSFIGTLLNCQYSFITCHTVQWWVRRWISGVSDSYWSHTTIISTITDTIIVHWLFTPTIRSNKHSSQVITLFVFYSHYPVCEYVVLVSITSLNVLLSLLQQQQGLVDHHQADILTQHWLSCSLIPALYGFWCICGYPICDVVVGLG